VNLELVPQRDRLGIFFQRTDLKGSPEIPALLSSVVGTERRVTLGKEGAKVALVEHLLSALAAMKIDSLLIKVDGPEVPILDGSAKEFIDILLKSGVEELPFSMNPIYLREPVVFSEGESHLVAFPSEKEVYSCFLSYPGDPILDWQSFIFPFEEEKYRKEIAPARTFARFEEVEILKSRGILQGGSLEYGVVIKEDQVLNPEGLRFPEEMVRHKVLDFIGDLSLMGIPLIAHFIAVRGGHTSHIAFAQKIEATCLEGLHTE
jgi:UDP-3-O-[3-hydroxymyristoyl] N-acetylglucosamine deacetylase